MKVTCLIVVLVVACAYSANAALMAGSVNGQLNVTYNWNSHYAWNFGFNQSLFWNNQSQNSMVRFDLNGFQHIPQLSLSFFQFCGSNPKNEAFVEFNWRFINSCEEAPCPDSAEPASLDNNANCTQTANKGPGPMIDGRNTVTYQTNCSNSQNFWVENVYIASSSNYPVIPMGLTVVVFNKIYQTTTNVTLNWFLNSWSDKAPPADVFQPEPRCQGSSSNQAIIDAIANVKAENSDAESFLQGKLSHESGNWPTDLPSPSPMEGSSLIRYLKAKIHQISAL